jgi:hypothetical protein
MELPPLAETMMSGMKNRFSVQGYQQSGGRYRAVTVELAES